MNISKPQIIEQTDDYAIVFKPPGMHSVPQRQRNEDTLVEWYEETGNADNKLPDSGLMHRLDCDTHGLVLFALNQRSFDFFKALQDKGELIKEYSAVCEGECEVPKIVMSYFRPYGRGRKQVRPVAEIKKYYEVAKDKAADAAGGFYRTEITGIQKTGKGNIFTIRIKRGFRHQIRSHLSWIGCPILNDPLYGRVDADDVSKMSVMALRAHAIIFTDPASGIEKECKIEKIMV